MILQEFLLTLITFSTVFNLLISLLLYRDYLTQKTLVTQLHQAAGQLALKLQQQEVILSKIGSAFNEFTNLVGSIVDKLDDMPMMPTGRMMFKTLDGKYASDNLEDFLRKVRNSDEPYLTDDEVERLRKMFGQEDDTDEEDDDNPFNPGKGSF
jgi:hypothetical protein